MERTLLDNDVVVKLGQYDLLGELLVLTNGPEPIRILPTLRFRFRLDSPERAMKLIRDQAAVQRIREFVGMVSQLEDEPSPDHLAILADTPQIDPGEAVLFAAAAADQESLTFTGDKRAITALVTTARAQSVAECLRGRIKCLEQIAAEMLLCVDAGNVIAKIRGKDWDTTLRICCSSGSAKETISALNSYYTHLNNECQSLLAPFPQCG